MNTAFIIYNTVNYLSSILKRHKLVPLPHMSEYVHLYLYTCVMQNIHLLMSTYTDLFQINTISLLIYSYAEFVYQ